MTKRASLPGADELFKTTTQVADEESAATAPVADLSTKRQVETATVERLPETNLAPRPRHEEKVTFYCNSDDIIRLDRAKLTLRAEHKITADRGRIVRQALAEILEDFEARGASSALVRALRQDS